MSNESSINDAVRRARKTAVGASNDADEASNSVTVLTDRVASLEATVTRLLDQVLKLSRDVTALTKR